MMDTQESRARLGILTALLVACSGADSQSSGAAGAGDGKQAVAEAKGPHGGRLLNSDGFTLELAIFERGVPPEFRAWPKRDGRPVDPAEVDLSVELTRLGNRVDQFAFAPDGDFLRGDAVVYEPHSFEVSIEALHEGKRHTWHYESFEGRTRIEAEVAEGLGVETAIAGPRVLKETTTVYGRIRPNPGRVREIRARFDGVVRSVNAEVGGSVSEGQKLVTVESNESLRPYSIVAPIGGVITQRDANPGEQTHGRLLLTITDTSSVWADLSIFPGDRSRVKVGTPATIVPATGGPSVRGIVSTIDVQLEANQAVVARVVLKNPDGQLMPGTYVTARVTVGEYPVPLAVKRTGLQSFRDFTVVYAQVGEEYEVRMVELGREAGEYVEVLGGLEPGTRYVTENSYLIKADIEKSGASHDH